MENELIKLRDELGNKLRRGNGGSWESDNEAIKEIFPAWVGAKDGTGWATDSIGDIAAAFAIWILYAHHSAGDVRADRPLTNVNITKSETLSSATFEQIFREPIRSIVDAKNLVQLNAAVDCVRDLLAAWEKRRDVKLCENCGTVIPEHETRTYSAAPGLPFVPICSVDCAAELDRKHHPAAGDDVTVKTAKAGCSNCGRPFVLGAGLYGDKRGVFCSEKCGREYPWPEDQTPADNAAADVAGPSSEPVVYWRDNTNRPSAARLCDACNRWFTGPAKLDAKFTFCGDDCANDSRIKYFQSKNPPAVTLRPPVSPEPVNCDKCLTPIPPTALWLITDPAGQERRLCSIDCVAAKLGLVVPTETDGF